jgi:phytoene desaturase
MSSQKRAAVIGSGFGGLAVAIRLQAAGVKTTIFEARDKPGGRAYVYEEDGHIFDAGPTVMTAPECIEELFEVAGKKMSDYAELLPVTPFYRLLWEDGDVFDYVGDQDKLVEQIRKRNPDDVEGYLRFVEYSKDVFHAGYDELAAQPFLRFSDMIRAAPELIRLRADRSVYSTVSRFMKDEHLRQAFSFHSLLVGGNPFETSSIYTLIHYLERKWGVSYPRGGTGALVRSLVKVFEEIGGEIRLEAPVDNVSVAGNTHYVTSASRTGEAFDMVVSNADLHHTYERLYRGAKGAKRRTKRLEKMNWSMSLFVLYFGTDITYEEQVEHHTILFGSRYKELLKDIFHGQSLPRDFSLYLHAPHVTDPSMAPEGRGTFYVLSPVPHLGNAPLDWSSIAEPYAEQILEYLESVLPDLRSHLTVKRWFHPQDFQTELAAYNGSAFSCAPNLTQSAYFRPHNRDAQIPNLYLVGAGTHPGAGVPGVINSAKATAKTIVEDHRL